MGRPFIATCGHGLTKEQVGPLLISGNLFHLSLVLMKDYWHMAGNLSETRGGASVWLNVC